MGRGTRFLAAEYRLPTPNNGGRGNRAKQTSVVNFHLVLGHAGKAGLMRGRLWQRCQIMPAIICVMTKYIPVCRLNDLTIAGRIVQLTSNDATPIFCAKNARKTASFRPGYVVFLLALSSTWHLYNDIHK